MNWLRSLALGLSFACFMSGGLVAQELPKGPIHLIVPSPPAGGIDPVARVMAKFLEKELSRTIVVENKPGAQTLLGSKYVANAKPDGATILISASISTYPVFYKDPGVDVLQDLEFVSYVMRAAEIFAINAEGPKTFAELAAYSKANPDKLNFASYGELLGLFTAMVAEAAGIKATEIKFNNPQDAAKAVAAGDAHFMLASMPTLKPWLPKITPLAVTTNARSPLLPDVQSMSEAGVKLDDLTVWMGVFAPKGTPRPIIDAYNSALRKFVADPESAGFLRNFGFEPYASSPEEFRQQFKAEQDRLMAVAQKMGIKPQ